MEHFYAQLFLDFDSEACLFKDFSCLARGFIGPMPVSMPEVVGKPASDVKAALEEDKLTVTTNDEFSDTVPAGQVMSSSEDAGAQLYLFELYNFDSNNGGVSISIS